MKKFALLFIACFFLSLHYGAILYVNSSLLGEFFSPEVVSLLFFLGALGNIILFFHLPRLIRVFGNKTLLILFLSVVSLSTFGLAFVTYPLAVAAIFVVYASLLYAIYYCLDLFLEDLSEDSMTGEVRGAWIALIHLGLIVGLIGLSLLSGTEEVHKPVYVAAGLILLPPLILAVTFKGGQNGQIRRHRTILPFKAWWRAKSVRRATIARFTLEFFYAFMTIYTPLYLTSVLGFDWSTVGVIFAIALVPFILLQWPAGKLADLFIGEKEMLIVGFLFMMGSLLFMPSLGALVVAWTVVLFASRIGASLAETLTDSYFFKHVDAADTGFLSIFRLTRPLSTALGAATGAVALNFLPFEWIFYILAAVVFFGLKEALLLRDTK